MGARRPQAAILALTASSLAGIAAMAGGDDPSGRGQMPGAGAAVDSRADLANRCFALATAEGGSLVAAGGDGYTASARRPRRAAVFFLEPTGIGTFMLQDGERMLLAAGAGEEAERSATPGEVAEWRIGRGPDHSFALSSTVDGRRLAVDPTGRRLVLANADSNPIHGFDFLAARHCARFPEAKVGASGRPFAGPNPDGPVFGYADIHMHVTANLRAGGRTIHGEPFNRFGISEALGHDEDDHGPDGSLDVTGNLLRDGSPAGTHDTEGWRSFAGWPVHDTYTHQQLYYRWLERAWMGGLRLVVAQAVEDEALCELEPLKAHSCDETETVKLAIRQLRRLERYVDAQSGGRGRGWFRLVRNPDEAREAIEQGQLAVVIGMETSSPLGCSEYQGEPQCTRADIDRVLSQLYRLGVRSVFVEHWVDNAYGGPALQGGAQGEFINVFENMTTGHPFATEPCGEADEADGTCNAKGLTGLGRYLIRQMIARQMLIEADHLSQKARAAVLEIAERRDYPLVSSHTGTGGEWTAQQLGRLYDLGGLASATPETAPDLVEKLLRLRRQSGRRRAAVALGTDTGGFASLPGPREDGGPPLRYPFRSHDGEVRFKRQRTGSRVFDLNTDGVAHYGLLPDLLADAARQPRGDRALGPLFRSAEAYLRMWQRAGA